MSSSDVIETLESIEGPLYPHVVIPVLAPLLKEKEIDAAEWFIQQISEMNISSRNKRIAETIIPLVRNYGTEMNTKLLKEYIRVFLKRGGKIEHLKITPALGSKSFWVREYYPEEIGKVLEDLLLLDDAIEWYTDKGLLEDAARIRKAQAEKVSQKVVQGDEITTIQDSVVSRSTIGSGAGDDLLSQLERLGALKEKGLITDEEFKITKRKLLKE